MHIHFANALNDKQQLLFKKIRSDILAVLPKEKNHLGKNSYSIDIKADIFGTEYYLFVTYLNRNKKFHSNDEECDEYKHFVEEQDMLNNQILDTLKQYPDLIISMVCKRRFTTCFPIEKGVTEEKYFIRDKSSKKFTINEELKL